MSVRYRYVCSSENTYVEETRSVASGVPTSCVNEGHSIVAGTLVIVAYPDEIVDLQFVPGATANFTNASVTGLSHASLSSIGTNTHAQIDTHLADATKHRQINDGGTSATELWSAAKITGELATKSATGHQHVAADVTDWSAAVAAHSSVAAATAHVASTANPHAVTKAQVGLSNVPNLKMHLSATVAPTAADDTTLGYGIGSRWIDTGADREYVCVDTTASAAVWRRTDVTDHADLVGAGSNTHSQIDSHLADATRHRQINDSGTSATELWSAAKISAQLATKSATGHAHTSADVTDFDSAADSRITAQKGAANGLATLDANQKIPTSQLPALAIASVSVVANLAARDALTVQSGDVAKVTDTGSGYPGTYIYDGSQWVDIQESSDVVSVNGQTGVVSLTTSDITEGSRMYYTTDRFDTRFNTRLATKTTSDVAEGTNLYFTEARVSANTDVAACTSHLGNTSNPHSVTKAQVGLSLVPNLKMNLVATTAPTVDDDNTHGYAIGSRWVDAQNGREYVCVDESTGAAWWRRTDIDSTSDVTEGSNKYFTDARFDTRLATRTTAHVTEGSNLYYTDARVAAQSDVVACTAHLANTSNPHAVTKAQVGLGNVPNLKVNLTASAAPTATDDTTQSYAVGSRWIDTVAMREYVCVKSVANFAVWQRTDILDHADLSGAGANSHAAIDAHLADATRHRQINDSGTSSTELWSASKISTQLATKSATDHTHTSSDITNFSTAVDARITAQKGAANGLATLDGNQKIPTSQLPALAVTSVSVVANLAARDALTGVEEGDVVKVTDTGSGLPGTYIYDGAAWVDIQESSDVSSVNGQTGVVSLTTTNINEGSNLYYTTARFDTRLATKTTSDVAEGTRLYYTEARVTANAQVAAATAHVASTSNPHSVTKAQVGLGEVANLKVNLVATSDPASTNDTNAGYAVGSRWFNTTTKHEFVCASAVASNALWKSTTLQVDQIGVNYSTASSTYGMAQTILYRGTRHVGIRSIRVVAAIDNSDAAYTFDIRVVDYDNNGAVVAEATGMTGSAKAIRNLGTVSNVPASDSVFEIHVRRSGITTGTTRVALYTLEFEYD